MRQVGIVLTAMLGLLPITAAAADAAAGKARSVTCVACHGPEGISPNELWPDLAGQKRAYLVKQIKAFRDGSRSDPLMTPMAAPLSDADIEDLAAYYNSLARN